MTLFGLLGTPFFALALYSLYRHTRGTTGGFLTGLRDLLSLPFLKGLLFGLPCLIGMRALSALLPVSFRPVWFFLTVLLNDHLLPFALAAAGVFLLLHERELLANLFFFYGFFSLLALHELLRITNRTDAYLLFILPALRMALPIFFMFLYGRFQEWYGGMRVLLGAAIGLPFLAAALVSYLALRSMLAPAAIGAGLFFGGAILVFLLSGDV